MKKIISLGLLFILTLSILVGCGASKTSAPQKTEEELKAEIRAEMEAEQKEREALEAEIRAKIEAEDKGKEEKEEAQEDTKREELMKIEPPKPEAKNDLATNSELNYDGEYNLNGFTNENINGIQVNYEEHITVIIPMYNGVNKNKLTPHSWDIGPNNLSDVTFAVFGKVENLKILHTNNAMSEEYTITKVGNIENALVTIKTEFSTDFSNVVIQGRVTAGEGYYHDIEFSLDDMRDLSEYKPIMIKY